jgi:release factor glutamine methyltransferase
MTTGGEVLLDAVVARLRRAGCVFAEDEAALLLEAAAGSSGHTDEVRLEALVERRVAGEPLEHVLGWVAFAGEQIAVGPGTFVPRRRTEVMVDEAVRRAPAAGSGRSVVVVELCCGVAAVGTVVAHRLRDAGRAVELHVADIDPVAIEWARRNVASDGCASSRTDAGHAYVGDLDEPLPGDLRGRVDLLLANAPYVPTEAIALMPPEARDHEPLVSLDGGADGLDVQRRLIVRGPGWLAPGGRLLVESSVEQAPVTAELMRGAGLEPSVVHDDEVDGTVVVGVRRA